MKPRDYSLVYGWEIGLMGLVQRETCLDQFLQDLGVCALK